MQQLPGSQYRLQFGLTGWASIIVGLAIFIVVATFLAIGFFFVVLPMIVLAPVIYYFMPRKGGHVVRTAETIGTMRTTGEEKVGAVIDGEYRVIEAGPNKER
jgi:O-antigen/teichoic acid export membrane protein